MVYTLDHDHQPSITGSNDSSSLDERSYIAPFQPRDLDVDSHASLIPAPRSTTVSITGSLDNVNTKSASNVTIYSGLPEVSCEENEIVIGNKQASDDGISTLSSSSIHRLQLQRDASSSSSRSCSVEPTNSVSGEIATIESIHEE